MSVLTTFILPNSINAVANLNQHFGRLNMPLLNSVMKIHKSSYCPIFLEVRNQNRQTITLIKYAFWLQIFDPDTQEMILTKMGQIVDEHGGKVRFIFEEDDFKDASPGIYNFSVKMVEPHTQHTTFLYLDQNYGVTGTFELLDNAMPVFQESILVKEFRPQNVVFHPLMLYNQQADVLGYYSPRLASFNSKNKVNGQHTFAVKMQNFYGWIIIQGTLEQDPHPNDLSSWFPFIIQNNNPYAYYSNFTGVDALNIAGALQYCRLIFIPDPAVLNPGQVAHLYYRS